jgi:hypothetical protein
MLSGGQQRGRRLTHKKTMTLALLSLLAAGRSGQATATAVSAFGRRLLARSSGGGSRGYAAFLAPTAGLFASSSPALVVKAATTPPATAELVTRRGGAGGGGGVFGSLTRLFSSGGGDAIRTEAPAVKSLEAAGPGAGDGFTGDLLVLPVFQPEEGEGLVEVAAQPILAAWDKALGGAVAELVQTVRALLRCVVLEEWGRRFRFFWGGGGLLSLVSKGFGVLFVCT